MAYHRKRVIAPCVSYMAAAEGAGSAVLHSVALWVSCLGLRLRQQLLCEIHCSPDRHQEQKRNLEWRSKHLLELGICTPAYAPLANGSHVLEPRLGGVCSAVWASPTQWAGTLNSGHFSGGGRAAIIGDYELIYHAHFQKLITYFLAFKEYWEWDHRFVLFLWLWVIVINNSDFP